MSETGKVVLLWWRRALDRETSHGRALSARLRRATPVEVMCEGAVHDLAQALEIKDPARLLRIVSVLAEVRDHISQTLSKRLGGRERVLSELRFQRLMRANDDELVTSLRRAVRIAGHRCNVAALGEDLMFWNERTRTRWCFHYFGAVAPTAISEETVE